MTLLSELIEIPEEVHKSDFVISLATAIHEPDKTLRDYVVTPQLAECFDRALSLIATSVSDQRSKASYLHASFGAGKTALMAVMHLLLAGNVAARSVKELAPVVSKYAGRLDGKKFLLVPYHFIGKTSMEQVVLGGYVDYIQTLHPDVSLPPVYVADGILKDVLQTRKDQGDEVFFRVLSEGEVADEWGEYGAGWDAARFETALEAAPGSSERDQLIGALLRSHYRAVPGQAQATAEGFVPLDAGLDAISRHATGLGYDAVILFLDELVLWLESRMSEQSFVSREGNKIVKLVEADASKRPIPIVSFIARQRDLRELVGEHVLGPEALSAMDVLRHSEGRFDVITLEDSNLPAIIEKRLLVPRTEQARQLLDDAFDKVRRELEERQERDVLLTETGDLAAFRRLYPFSPALVDSLVALSGAMQRERTALKVMLQLLVDNRDRLQLGELVPLGDLWDAINADDEPLTEVMRAQFAQARRLWAQRFQPLLLREHSMTEEEAGSVDSSHAYVTDARLMKSLLVAALVPEVAPLRGLTVSRLTALNSGIVRAFVPGTERQQVLEKLRRWGSEIGELRLGDDDHDPTVSVELSGIDTGPIVEAARIVDTDGERRRRVKELLGEALQIKDASSLDPWAELTWRGTRRRIQVVFSNVRDPIELPDDMLRAGADPKLVIDFPWDVEDFGPTDDRGRVTDYRSDKPPEWTAVWLPNFLSGATRLQLGQLVRLEYILSGDTFEGLASHLSPSDRPAARAQLANQLSAVRERLMSSLRQAYGVDPAQGTAVEERLSLGEQFIALDPGLTLQPPVGTSLRTHLEGIADQLFSHKFPKHPEFTELVSKADLNHTLGQLTLALQGPNGRLENVDAPMRRVLTRVATPLELGTMYQAHFVADVSRWTDLIEKRRAEAGISGMTIAQVRQWLDGSDSPTERRGLSSDVGDLIILAVAIATNRAVVAAGQPVARPEIGRLRDEWELHPQVLPSTNIWATALGRAQDMGIVPTSSLLSANTVVDLRERVHSSLVEGRAEHVRDLFAALQAAYTRLGLVDGKRLETARASVALVDELRRQPDRIADSLAAAEIPTSSAAMGTSIAQSEVVATELNRLNWELINAAVDLGDPWKTEAQALTDQLVEALREDELAVPLVGALRKASASATDLVRRATKSPELPETEDKISRETAESELTRLQQRLRTEAALDLRWKIVELGDDDPT